MTEIKGFKWLCGRCHNWNRVEDGVCKHCKALREDAAQAWRLENKLTPLETAFYEQSVPTIIGELRSIRLLLERMVK